MSNAWYKNGFVVCFGGTIDKSGNFSERISVCKILEIGESDLLLEDYPSKTFSRPFKISKNICCLLDIDPSSVVSSRPVDPKIGDLVLSFSSARFDTKGSEPITGILYSITYQNGQPSVCKIMCGDEMKDGIYDNLMVVQSYHLEH